MKKSGQQIMHDLSMEAREVFQRNADTLVAGFLVRHPDVDPSDIRLIYETIGSTMRFRVEYLALHVPEAEYRHRVGPEHDQVDEWGTRAEAPENEHAAYDAGHVDGWNAARQWVLNQAKSVIAPDGLVITLAQVRELSTDEEPAPEPIKLTGDDNG